MPKVIIFTLGVLVGGAGLVLAQVFGAARLPKSDVEQALENRLESIPVESICEAIVSGKQILGEDRVTVWSDGQKYRVVGWQVAESGAPVTSWTGADVPDDGTVPCRKK